MRMFYEVYPFFAYCCVGAEFFYILLYVLYFMPGNTIVRVVRARSVAAFAWAG